MRSIAIILLLFFLVIVGCKKEFIREDVYLTPMDKTWNIYHVDDTLIFRSNLRDTRIYVVSDVNTRMIERCYEVDDFDGDVCYDHETIFVTINRTDTALSMTLPMTRGYPFHGDDFSITFFWKEFGDYVGLAIPGNDTVTINNIEYNGVKKTTGHHNMKCFYYHRQKGFLRFEYTNGEVWERSN